MAVLSGGVSGRALRHIWRQALVKRAPITGVAGQESVLAEFFGLHNLMNFCSEDALRHSYWMNHVFQNDVFK
jgi:hypothetical protein